MIINTRTSTYSYIHTQTHAYKALGPYLRASTRQPYEPRASLWRKSAFGKRSLTFPNGPSLSFLAECPKLGPQRLASELSHPGLHPSYSLSQLPPVVALSLTCVFRRLPRVCPVHFSPQHRGGKNPSNKIKQSQRRFVAATSNKKSKPKTMSKKTRYSSSRGGYSLGLVLLKKKRGFDRKHTTMKSENSTKKTARAYRRSTWYNVVDAWLSGLPLGSLPASSASPLLLPCQPPCLLCPVRPRSSLRISPSPHPTKKIRV